MNRFCLLLLLFCSFQVSQAQTAYLFVKKGAKKKKTYLEYDRIYLRLHDGTVYGGMITRLMNDTIFISGKPVPVTSVKEVLLPNNKKEPFHISTKDFLLITGGVVLVTAGLTVSNQASFNEALLAGTVIGYGPLAVAWLGRKISFRRKKYTIGKKFHLQVLDFYLPRRRAF